jgi:hypothetical protein
MLFPWPHVLFFLNEQTAIIPPEVVLSPLADVVRARFANSKWAQPMLPRSPVNLIHLFVDLCIEFLQSSNSVFFRTVAHPDGSISPLSFR